MFLFFLFLTLFAMCMVVSNAAVQSFGNDLYTVQVQVQSNQPRYTFYANEDSNKYKVSFSKIYEKLNGNMVGGSNLALASIDWVIAQDLEDDDDDDDTVVFWINGTTRQNGNSANRFSVLSFKNYIIDYTVKFDVYLEGYKWVNSASESLDLEWKMSNATAPDTSVDTASDEEDSKICFNGADDTSRVCWIVEETAIATNAAGDETEVDVTLDLDGGFIVVSYENWGEGDLFHDPQFGYEGGFTKRNECGGVFYFLCIIMQFIMSMFGL